MEQSSLARPGGLLVYVASNPLRGTSHLLRSLTLAEQWLSDGGKVSYVADRLPKILERQIAFRGCQLRRLKSQPAQDEFALELCQLATSERCDWIALDDSDSKLIRRVSELRSSNQKILVLGESDEGVDFCTGTNPAFALIRNSIRKDKSPSNSNRKVVRCLLDFSRLSKEKVYLVSKQLAQSNADRPIHLELVSAFAAQIVDQLKSQNPEFKGRIDPHLNADRVFQNLTDTQLVISSDESSFYETAFFGLPSVLLTEKGRMDGLSLDLTTVPWLVDRHGSDWISQTKTIMEQLLRYDRVRKQHADEMARLVDSHASVRLSYMMQRFIVSPSRVRTA